MTIADTRIPGAPAPAARPAPRRPETPEEREAFLRAESQAQRLRELWSRSRDEARDALADYAARERRFGARPG